MLADADVQGPGPVGGPGHLGQVVRPGAGTPRLHEDRALGLDRQLQPPGHGALRNDGAHVRWVSLRSVTGSSTRRRSAPRAADGAGERERSGTQQDVEPAVGGAVGRQLVERPQLALRHSHVDEVEHVHRQQTAGSSPSHTSKTSVSVATAATSWSWSHSTAVVAWPGRGVGEAVQVALAEEVHLPGPDEQHVARLCGDAAGGQRGVEVVAADRVAVVEVVDAVDRRVGHQAQAAIGPNVSMPSRWAPAASTTPASMPLYSRPS